VATSSDAEVIRAFITGTGKITDFIASSIKSEPNRIPNPLCADKAFSLRFSELLEELKSLRPPALQAGFRTCGNFDAMSGWLNSCIHTFGVFPGNEEQLGTVRAFTGLLNGVHQYLAVIEDVAQLAETSETPPPRQLRSAKSEKEQSKRQDLILETMLALKATDPARRKTTEEIAKAAEGPEFDPVRFKRPIADLKRRGLIDTKDGRDGGCWLTSIGRDKATQIQKLKKR